MTFSLLLTTKVVKQLHVHGRDRRGTRCSRRHNFRQILHSHPSLLLDHNLDFMFRLTEEDFHREYGFEEVRRIVVADEVVDGPVRWRSTRIHI